LNLSTNLHHEKKGKAMLLDAQLNDFEDFSPIAVGTYEFVIKEPMEVIPSVDEKTDIGGKKYTFIIRPEICGGEHAGKKIRRQLSNGSKASRYFLKSFLEKIGVKVNGSGQFNSEDVLGRRFKGTVVERPYTKDGEAKKASDIETESIVAL
jgi:hypothetical protein